MTDSLIDMIRKANAGRGNTSQQPSLIDEIKRTRAVAAVRTGFAGLAGLEQVTQVTYPNFPTTNISNAGYPVTSHRRRGLKYLLAAMASALAISVAVNAHLKKEYQNKLDYNTSQIAMQYKGKGNAGVFDRSSISDLLIYKGYDLAVVDKSLEIPFNISPDALKVADSVGKSKVPDEEKAREIFQWIDENITYGKSKRNGIGYRNSNEVYETKEGVCGEVAYLYVTMARLAGIESNWVHVMTDNKGEKVKHACASVKLGENQILVDPAYHTYDIHHQEYEIMNDEEAILMFKEMRD